MSKHLLRVHNVISKAAFPLANGQTMKADLFHTKTGEGTMAQDIAVILPPRLSALYEKDSDMIGTRIEADRLLPLGIGETPDSNARPVYIISGRHKMYAL